MGNGWTDQRTLCGIKGHRPLEGRRSKEILFSFCYHYIKGAFLVTDTTSVTLGHSVVHYVRLLAPLTRSAALRYTPLVLLARSS